MQRATLPGLILLLFLSMSCGKAAPMPESTTESATHDSSTPSVAAPTEDLSIAFYGLVERARIELEALSGLDLSDLNFSLTDKDAVLDTLMSNLSLQVLDGDEELTREALAGFAEGMIGIYSMENGDIRIALENLEGLSELFEKPGAYSEEILFAVIAHEGAHAVADRKYGMVALIESRETSDQLDALNAVFEGHAQWLSRQVCSNAGFESGFLGMTELTTTTPEMDDPVLRMALEITVQIFAFAYVDGESFVNALYAAKGEEGIKQAFSSPPSGRNSINHPDWYLDPSKRPESNYQIEDALQVFDDFFMDQALATQRIDLDKGMLRAAASALPHEDIDRFSSAVLESRATIGNNEQSDKQEFVVAALHQCQSEEQAALYISLSKQLVAAKAELMKGSAFQITKSDLQKVDRPGFSGFELQQIVEAFKTETPAQTVLLHQGDLVCEITLLGIEVAREKLLDLAVDVLNKAVNSHEE